MRGSMLGPLLFIMYINDLPTICKQTNTILYADDTVIFTSDPSINNINANLTSDLHLLNQWLNESHLTINIEKTQIMYFHSPRKTIPISTLVTISNQAIQCTESYKYLGVLLDNHLTYNKHVISLTNKLKQKLYVYNKIRPYINQYVSNIYLNAIILSKLSYCLPVWSLTTKEILHPLERLYNRTFKIHARLSNWTHHCTALSHSNALTFTNYSKLQAIKFFYQIQSNSLPTIINSLLPNQLQRYARTTRSSTQEHIRVPRHKNKYGQHAYIRKSILTWNQIPLQIRTTTSVTQFKQHFTNFLKTTQSCTHNG